MGMCWTEANLYGNALDCGRYIWECTMKQIIYGNHVKRSNILFCRPSSQCIRRYCSKIIHRYLFEKELKEVDNACADGSTEKIKETHNC